MKRVFDVLAAGLGLIILLPVFIIVAVAIKTTSTGPVFYRGIRTGRDGVPFRLFKFRTMVKDAESLGGPSTGLHDTRVTVIGKTLRQYKVDELPNLINVVMGQMSLVGPRPEVPLYTSWYTGDEKSILSVRPGITDLSSIRYNDLASHVGSENVDDNFEKFVLPEKHRLRVEYVNSRSFLGDLKIIFRTFTCLFASRKSDNGVR